VVESVNVIINDFHPLHSIF